MSIVIAYIGVDPGVGRHLRNFFPDAEICVSSEQTRFVLDGILLDLIPSEAQYSAFSSDEFDIILKDSPVEQLLKFISRIRCLIDYTSLSLIKRTSQSVSCILLDTGTFSKFDYLALILAEATRAEYTLSFEEFQAILNTLTSTRGDNFYGTRAEKYRVSKLEEILSLRISHEELPEDTQKSLQKLFGLVFTSFYTQPVSNILRRIHEQYVDSGKALNFYSLERSRLSKILERFHQIEHPKKDLSISNIQELISRLHEKELTI